MFCHTLIACIVYTLRGGVLSTSQTERTRAHHRRSNSHSIFVKRSNRLLHQGTSDNAFNGDCLPGYCYCIIHRPSYVSGEVKVLPALLLLSTGTKFNNDSDRRNETFNPIPNLGALLVGNLAAIFCKRTESFRFGFHPRKKKHSPKSSIFSFEQTNAA